MTDLPAPAVPAPLVPVDCDLRGFPHMQLDVRRLLTSETWVLGTAEEKVAALTLWSESWHQVPAASVPDNDRMLAHLSQAGGKWAKVRAHVLRRWVKCSDGRLYHPVVAEKAIEAWASKQARRERDTSDVDRKRREREDRKRLFATLRDAGSVAPFQTLTADLRRMVGDLSRGTEHDTSRTDHDNGHELQRDMSRSSRDVSRLREGEGEGDREVSLRLAASAPGPESENGLAELRKRIATAFGDVLAMPPDTAHAGVWLARGYRSDLIVAVIRAKLATKPNVRALSYFDDPIREAHERQPTAIAETAPVDPVRIRKGNLILARAFFAGEWSDGWQGPKPGEPGFPEDVAAEAAREAGAPWPPLARTADRPTRAASN